MTAVRVFATVSFWWFRSNSAIPNFKFREMVTRNGSLFMNIMSMHRVTE